eukprot:jgi/Antlo1/187/286
MQIGAALRACPVLDAHAVNVFRLTRHCAVTYLIF